jgi:hypothetical protein
MQLLLVLLEPNLRICCFQNMDGKLYLSLFEL